jgi:hypothetical protein
MLQLAEAHRVVTAEKHGPFSAFRRTRILAAALVLGLHTVLVIGIRHAPATLGAPGESRRAPAVPVLLYRDEPVEVYAPDYPDITVHLPVPRPGDIPLIPGVSHSAGATTLSPPTETRAVVEERLLAIMPSDPATVLPAAIPTDPEGLQSTCRSAARASAAKEGNERHLLVRLFVTGTGHAAAARVDESSGDPSFDAFVVRCIKASGEFAAPKHDGSGEWQQLLWVIDG